MGCKVSILHSGFENRFVSLLEKLPITDFQRENIKSRYVREVIDIETDYRRSVILFIGLTNLITISGILVTSLTSLTKAVSVGSYWQDTLQWVVFALGLSLTLANGWMTTFGIYKRYVINDVTLGKMYTEGWAFLAGVNRYELVPINERVDIFTAKIEQIITKTTIVQMGDNTAGINVHDVLEIPHENVPSVPNAADNNIVSPMRPDSMDVIINIDDKFAKNQSNVPDIIPHANHNINPRRKRVSRDQYE